MITIKDDPDSLANYDGLCSKGNALAKTIGLENRLLYPEVNGQKIDWDTALQATAIP